MAASIGAGVVISTPAERSSSNGGALLPEERNSRYLRQLARALAWSGSRIPFAKAWAAENPVAYL